MAECVNETLPGLSAYVQDDWFKLYASDIGLLSSVYGMLVKRQVLDGTLKGPVKGGLYENFVASVLHRLGAPLRYYKNHSTEVEFLVEGMAGIEAIEVKAQTGRTISLDMLLRRDMVTVGYKLTGGNVGTDGKKVTLPHYCVLFIR